MSKQREHVNANGNLVVHSFYDTWTIPTAETGWKLWKTDDDSEVYGIWIKMSALAILIFDRGDEFLITCPDIDKFVLELHDLEERIGPLSEGERLTGTEARKISLNTNGIRHESEA